VIGAIADDFTGATDVAVSFRRSGLQTVVLFGIPHDELQLPQHDAVVIGLKTRTIPSQLAVAESLAAATWLRERGADSLYFKYCSTFDSKPEGNIGPVADALADFMNSGISTVVPSSPEHGRTQYLGHLFVGEKLLSESPMRHHPLTPMTDSEIPRVMQSQTARPVGLIAHDVVRRGTTAIESALNQLRESGIRYAVVDAIDDVDLAAIGSATASHALVTGAAGLAWGLGTAVAARAGDSIAHPTNDDPVGDLPAAVLAGSCSARTREQIAVMSRDHDSYFLDALKTPDAEALAHEALAWYDGAARYRAPLFYSSVSPERLRLVQETLGVEESSNILEGAIGLIALGLVHRGVRRIVVAGGETSGSVVTSLGVSGGLIGPELAPGVPWIYTAGERPLALLLKSGNFGEPEMLVQAVDSAQSLERTA